jgi:hypothetical protein
MYTPGVDGNLLLGKGALPCVDMQVIRVDQGAVDIEENRWSI